MSKTLLPFTALVVASISVACSAGIKSSFKPTDTSFVAAPGTSPPVYLYPADVPKLAWRSVGIIEVTIPGSSSLTDTIKAAAAKGKQVGCAALIEHSVFAHMKTESWYGGPDGARLRLVHGGGASSSPQAAPSKSASRPAETTRFDCVLKPKAPPPTTA